MAGRDLRVALVAGVLALVAAGCGGDDDGVTAGASQVTSTSVAVAPTTAPPTSSEAEPTTAPPTSAEPTTTADDPPTTTEASGPLAEGLGDEPFPELGNPNVDVSHYDLALTWDQAGERISGTVTIDLSTTQLRPSFTLDAQDSVEVSAVTVDGRDATFEHDVPELVITPSFPMVPSQTHSVVVTYTSRAGGENSAAGLPGGWIATENGAYTLNEPDLARTWLPSNDHPSDKATWTFRLTVPDGQIAVANGALVGDGPAAGNVWTWEMDEPMATYLVGIVIGPFQHVTGTTAAGLALSSAVLPEDLDAVQPYLDLTGPMIDFFDDLFGPYPFASYGISTPDSVPGLAMEQQTRSLIPRTLFEFSDRSEIEAYLSHELAHQWFGDAVTPASWQDIWLNEGFATYAQWLWSDHQGFQSLEDAADNGLSFGRRVSTGEPGFELFGGEVYDGGGVVLHALRRTIGDDAFFETLRRWVADNEGTSRTTADFIATAERVSGQELGEFFDDWLYTTDTPNLYP